MIIRQAVSGDLPAILDIYNDAILNTTAVYDYQPHTLAMRETWFNTKVEQRMPVLVAEDSGMIQGFASYGPFRAWAAYQYTVENAIYVHPAHRGKGIAKALMQPLIEAARKQQLHTMVAGIDASNAASIALHRQFGFEEVACFKEVGYKFNRWLDLVFLQLML
ncbi:GNAT family N-acetyltransferase [Flavihumibacter petaseus]|uniref:L-amino acid N-acyltransferase n=1 Tax=Flavihumibacter petaseus NBRC 106054 TaxID=1220578 RepID=A0A0E9N2D3_9BACT|nr:GNAT family N-acetyltransferase [Flavihumibacter petaseus]GAO43480.1 L-amino acid N-acyltransferase [Flavihumibacter petaseus NBRC 106054]